MDAQVKSLNDHEQITLRIMGWLSKIFKGSSHKISEGHYRDKYREEPTSYAPSHSGETWSENDNEEINCAIALSLLEESQKGKRLIDNDSQLQEDEQLARALQESLNVESPPRYGNGSGNGNGSANSYQPIPVYYPMGYRICAGCQIEIGYGRYLNCLNAFWHPECFRCRACNLRISDYSNHQRMLMILSIQISRGQARHRFPSSILPSLWSPVFLPRSALTMSF
ncbi:Zinc finger, LIM-type [Trema orientale]|uniref:Zinc finger, LIM-type n=1 Tax=Trema orientale TaxID=63057 RepID=A0A2P5F1F9_TREOI|nr:Zinc finger, LIM-type [Trema orientale]